jgi:putative membrane protein
MKPVFFAAVSALALMPFATLSASAQSEPNMVGVTDSQPWNQTGKVFAQNMMMSDKFEIASSRLALDKSRDPAVRDFARDMIGAHSETSNDLKEVVDRTVLSNEVTPPPQLDPRHMSMYHALEASFGRDFDREYLAQQFAAHREALAYMEGYARHADMPELQRFAAHTVPVIRDHLAMLRSIRGDVATTAPDSDVALNVPPDTTVIAHPDGTTTTVIDTE